MKKLLIILLLAVSSSGKAQTSCDSLDIEVTYYPFDDSLIQVSVTNHAQELFGYPIFTIFDSNGDTVALEQLNFFGIGQSSIHTLYTFPGMPASSVFSGTLQLVYSTIDSYAVCTWPMNFDLCPDTCKMFYPYLANNGSMNVTGSATWEILDDNSVTVASGIFTLDTNSQYATDSACLGAGHYTLKVNGTNLSPGGQKTAGITNNVFTSAPDTAFNDTVATVPFTLYGPCITTTGIKQTALNGQNLQIYAYGSNIFIRNMTGKPIGNLAVYTIDGKRLIQNKVANAKETINLAAYPTGIYVIKAQNETGIHVRKVFIEN